MLHSIPRRFLVDIAGQQSLRTWVLLGIPSRVVALRGQQLAI